MNSRGSNSMLLVPSSDNQVAYLERALASGLELSAAVRRASKISKAWAFIPEAWASLVSLDPRYDPGVALDPAMSDRYEALAREFSARLPKGMIITEDFIHRPGDLANEGLDVRFVNGVSHWFVSLDDIATATDRLREASNLPFSLYFGTSVRFPTPTARESFDQGGNISFAESIAASTVLVAADAFDGVGFVIGQLSPGQE